MMTQPHTFVSRDGPSPPDRQTSLPGQNDKIIVRCFALTSLHIVYMDSSMFTHCSTVGSTLNSPDLELACFLCESPVDVKLEPCGHAMMCSTCAQRAKKCPKPGCKVQSCIYRVMCHS